jgi:hypothetical protein
MLTDIQETLLSQLTNLNPLFTAEYNVKTIIGIDEGLRLHTKQNKHTVNIDIIYDCGQDLYIIKGYRVNGVDFSEIATIENVYFDQLHDIIKEIIKMGG